MTSTSPAPWAGPNPLSGVMFGSFRPPPGRVGMPDVCCDLVWMRERLMLSGPQSRGAPNTSTGEPIQLMNVDPLVARAWLGVPLSELTDCEVPLEDVAPDMAGALSEAFFSGAAVGLVRPLGPPPRDHRRVAAAAAALRAGWSVRAAAGRAELSVRQLERLFRDAYGLSPVRYRRILRFRRSVAALREGETLAGAAAVTGFADQAHFSREVQALIGHPPSALLARVAKVQEVMAKTRDY
jgi:AraC-like DNA-binding protein